MQCHMAPTCKILLRDIYITAQTLLKNYKSLMTEWLRRRLRDMKFPSVHDLQMMSSNPGRVKLGVRNTSV